MSHFEELMRKLQSAFSDNLRSTPTVPTPLWELGQICVAQCNEDQLFYRVRIVSLANEVAEVFYLDYGNIETVSISGLMPIPSDLLEYPAQAIQCSLAEVSPETEHWEEASCSRFEEMIYHKELVANVVDVLDDVVFVDLQDEMVSLNNSLVQSGYAVQSSSKDPYIALSAQISQAVRIHESSCTEENSCRMDLPSPIAGSENGCHLELNNIPSDVLQFNLRDYEHLEIDENSDLSVRVCNIKNPSDFGLKLVASSCDLESLMSDIAEHVSIDETSPVNSDHLTVGFLCLAQCSDDDAWYRAKITDIKDNQYKVLYVDYGNSELLPECKIRELPNRMLSLPVQYLPCCLADIWANGQSWEKESISFFTALCKDKVLNARVSRRENGLYHVYLFDMEDPVGWSLNRYLLYRGVGVIPGSDLDIEMDMEENQPAELDESFLSWTTESYYDCENGSSKKMENTEDVDKDNEDDLTETFCAEVDQDPEETKEASAIEAGQPEKDT